MISARVGLLWPIHHKLTKYQDSSWLLSKSSVSGSNSLCGLLLLSLMPVWMWISITKVADLPRYQHHKDITAKLNNGPFKIGISKFLNATRGDIQHNLRKFYFKGELVSEAFSTPFEMRKQREIKLLGEGFAQTQVTDLIKCSHSNQWAPTNCCKGWDSGRNGDHLLWFRGFYESH